LGEKGAWAYAGTAQILICNHILFKLKLVFCQTELYFLFKLVELNVEVIYRLFTSHHVDSGYRITEPEVRDSAYVRRPLKVKP